MKAAQINEYSEQGNVQITDIPQPEVTEGKVLVEVHAAGVNPIDWKVATGYAKSMVQHPFPFTLGGDIAGVVKAVGAGVTNVKESDKVYGQANILGGQTGAFAEFAVTSATSLGIKPEKLSMSEAGAAPLTGVSAIQALYDHIQLNSGQKILIHGGAGGIGTMAIQIAKHIGAHVATTVSESDREFVKSLGADEVIDYKNQKFEDTVKEYDAVYDLVGGETFTRSYAVLKQGGKLVTMAAQPDEELAKQYNVEAIGQYTVVNTERLNKLSELINDGVITIHIEKTFPLDESANALVYLRNTPPKGKVVIEVK